MAEAKETKRTAKSSSLEDATKFSDDPTKNENVNLTDDEKMALEVQTKATEGDPFGGKFKLKDPSTSYSEPDFTLTGDQEKELPENPSPELIARIRSGFIIKA